MWCGDVFVSDLTRLVSPNLYLSVDTNWLEISFLSGGTGRAPGVWPPTPPRIVIRNYFLWWRKQRCVCVCLCVRLLLTQPAAGRHQLFTKGCALDRKGRAGKCQKGQKINDKRARHKDAAARGTEPLAKTLNVWSLTVRHGGWVVITVASQKEGSGFESRSSRWFQVLSVWSLHVLLVSAWVSSGYSG